MTKSAAFSAWRKSSASSNPGVPWGNSEKTVGQLQHGLRRPPVDGRGASRCFTSPRALRISPGYLTRALRSAVILYSSVYETWLSSPRVVWGLGPRGVGTWVSDDAPAALPGHFLPSHRSSPMLRARAASPTLGSRLVDTHFSTCAQAYAHESEHCLAERNKLSPKRRERTSRRRRSERTPITPRTAMVKCH